MEQDTAAQSQSITETAEFKALMEELDPVFGSLSSADDLMTLINLPFALPLPVENSDVLNRPDSQQKE
eukprot:m.116620 g.116620  ORF g.116620 m.116620 type:complete len:68 (+) comp15404_c0_seq2:187-390(+)